MTATDTHGAIEAVFRIERAKLIAGLARVVRDVGLAEELAQDALVSALEQWPQSGIPDKPGAWLMAAAKNRAIDRLRRARLIERKHQEIGHDLEIGGEGAAPDLDAALDDDIGDDLLRLMFTACHPVLSTEARVALTLRLLGGLTTDEIARAFLVAEPTMAQRIVRAKRTLTEKRVPFEVPRGAERAERLASVLEAIYLIFNEGYTATAGGDWARPQLCEEALRLGRVLAELAPEEAEVHGLVALMEIQASRLKARIGPDGEPDPAPRPGPRPLGPAADPARADRAGAGGGPCRGAACGRWPLSAASGHSRLPRPCAGRGRHGLGAHCGALRGARAGYTFARGRAQPRGGGGHGVGSGRGPQAGRSPRRRAGAQGLSSPAQRPRRPVAEARPPR